MSPPLDPISQRNLIKKLKNFGFEGPFSGGKHLFMIKGDLSLTIPNPHGRDIGVGLLNKILKQAGISRKQWVQGA